MSRTPRFPMPGSALPESIDPGEPPALLVHGTNDDTIPFSLAEKTGAAATAVGVVCELIPHENGHGFSGDLHSGSGDDPTVQLTIDFLNREVLVLQASHRCPDVETPHASRSVADVFALCDGHNPSVRCCCTPVGNVHPQLHDKERLSGSGQRLVERGRSPAAFSGGWPPEEVPFFRSLRCGEP